MKPQKRKRRISPPPRPKRHNPPSALGICINALIQTGAGLLIEAATRLRRVWWHCKTCQTVSSGPLPSPGFSYHCENCRQALRRGPLPPLQPWQGKPDRAVDVTFEDVTHPRLAATKVRPG